MRACPAVFKDEPVRSHGQAPCPALLVEEIQIRDTLIEWKFDRLGEA